ncbi:MAG: glycosyltransferase [Elusimicrobia bacterium]|nr:glycosyltransferase [Elusimicrobiota bacterium]
MDKITVVIPTLDRRESVIGCVESVLSQTRAPDEVVTVDNGSSDGTPDALRRRFERRIRVLSEPRRGVAYARNRGIDAAAGQIVAFIDDDALAASDWLAHLEACLTQTQALGTGGPAEPVWEAPPPSWLSRSSKALSSIGAFSLGTQRKPLNSRREFLIGTNCAFRRSVFDAGHRFLFIGAGRPGFGMEDVEFSVRIARIGPVYYEPAARVLHHIPKRKLTMLHLAASAFDNGRKKAAIGRPLLPRWKDDWKGVDAWMSAFSVAGYAAQRASRRPFE